MPRFAANLHYLFTEVPFRERFAEAARAGFTGVEFQVPYDHDPAMLAGLLRRHGLQMVLFDAPMGHWDDGDRGLACRPEREAEFLDSLPLALEYARALDCGTVHVMAGVVGPGDDLDLCRQTYVRNLRLAADFFAPHEVTVVIEPINPRFGRVEGGAAYITCGMHGYFLNTTQQALEAIAAADHPGLGLHLDCYHLQILEGNLSETLERHVGQLRHVQIAGVPGRHEPDVGEIHYPWIFDLLDRSGYEGWVGCEYRPRGGTWAGLGWALPWGIGPGAVRHAAALAGTGP